LVVHCSDERVAEALDPAVRALRRRGWTVRFAPIPASTPTPPGDPTVDLWALFPRDLERVPAARALFEALELPGVPRTTADLEPYLGAHGALVAQSADPAQPDRASLLALGGSPVALVGALRELEPARREAWLLLDERGPVRGGALEGWRGSEDFVRSAALAPGQAAVDRGERRLRVDWVEARVAGELDFADAQAYTLLAKQAADTVLELVDPERPYAGPAPHLYLVGNAERLLALGESDLACSNPIDRSVVAWLGPETESGRRLSDGGAEFARALALARLGEPYQAWLLDGLGVDASGSWWGQGLGEWCAHLARAGLLDDLSAILEEDDSPPGLSPHVRGPARGLLLRILRTRMGPAVVRSVWQGASLPQAASAAFQSWVDAARVQPRADLARRAELLAGPNRVGAVLQAGPCDSPLDEWNFGTAACRAGLRELADLGANSIALEFNASMEPSAVEWPGRPRRFQPYAAVDLALAAAASEARRLGLRPALRPVLLRTDGGQLAAQQIDSIVGGSAEFFACFEQVLLHAALLGELLEAELLCLGHGMPVVSATRTVAAHVPDGAAQWQALIARLRGVFGGLLTYGADLHSELPGIEFWDALDWVGIELFPPLDDPFGSGQRPSDEAASARLADEMRQLVAAAARIQRRGLITAVGFHSTSEAWRWPHRPLGATDPKEQARLVTALREAWRSYLPDATVLAGCYYYAWSLDPHARGSEHRGSSVRDKPAEVELERLFRSN
jgi:hypothetical protein